MHIRLNMYASKYLLQYRLSDLMRSVESSISIKDIREKHKVPTTHEYSLKSFVESSCTQGKVEAATVVRGLSSSKFNYLLTCC